MISVIKKMIMAGIEGFARSLKTEPASIQFLISGNNPGNTYGLKYFLYKDLVPVREISFWEAIARADKIKFVDYEQLSAQFIINKMNGYVEVDKVDPGKLYFIIYFSKGQEELMVKVMNGIEKINCFSLKELFQ